MTRLNVLTTLSGLSLNMRSICYSSWTFQQLCKVQTNFLLVLFKQLQLRSPSSMTSVLKSQVRVTEKMLQLFSLWDEATDIDMPSKDAPRFELWIPDQSRVVDSVEKTEIVVLFQSKVSLLFNRERNW